MESVREIDVQWGDLDSLAIVFYPHFFAWADAASHQLFREAAIPFDALARDHKVSFGLVSAAADFHHPGRYGERLVFRSSVGKLGKRSIEIVHRVFRAADETPVATIRETRACMDVSEPERIRARELPRDVTERLKRFEDLTHGTTEP